MIPNEDWKHRPAGFYYVRLPFVGKPMSPTDRWMIVRWNLEYAMDHDGHGWMLTENFTARDFKKNGDPWIIVHGPLLGQPQDGRPIGFALQ